MSVLNVSEQISINPSAVTWKSGDVAGPAVAFHQNLAGYVPTRLIDQPLLAEAMGVGRVLVKDESARFGLPAFKALGASWAIAKAVEKYEVAAGATITTATDGNHGRAVARVSRNLGYQASIFIPNGVSEYAIEAIRAEGATVTLIDGDYDEAVAASAAFAQANNAILIQDTAWEGYQEVPSWIVEGYSTMVAEVDAQLKQLSLQADLVLVPTGVGSLLQAVIAHYRAESSTTHVASVEPINAAGVLESLKAGELVSVPTQTTIMAGLNCGTPSTLAMPYILQGLSAAVTVDDSEAREALADLLAADVAVGPCGAAALAGARRLLGSQDVRQRLNLTQTSVVVLLSTESAEANPI